MTALGRLADLVDALVTGRPPRVIERQFGWLRDLGYAIQESGWRGMELYATYESDAVLVRVLEEYHYGFVGVWLARAHACYRDGAGPDVDLARLLASRAPDFQWDRNYDTNVRGAGEAKLAEAAQLLRENCVDILMGENLSALEPEGESNKHDSEPNAQK